MPSNKTPAAIAIGTALAGGLALSGSGFAMQPLAQGYMLAVSAVGAGDKLAEGSCGADKMKEGACGAEKSKAEGSCGMEKMDADKDGRISRTEFAAAHGGKDDKFPAHDPDGNGFISAEEMQAHHAADRKDDGGDKSAAEGKCGEGKCGEGKCGSN